MKSIDHKKALEFLKKDVKLKRIIEKYDLPDWSKESDLFEDIVESIINQQLSGKAAATIFGRFKKLFTHSASSGQDDKFPTPEQILKVYDEEIRECGVSFQKINYIKGLSTAIVKKELDLDNLKNLIDEDVIKELTKIKGIGRWTAEMILIFSLKRPDIFSVGDLGLRIAVSKLYNIDREDKIRIEKKSKIWSPHRSLVSWFLWRSLENR